jgi:hypothetical protein
MRTLRLSLVGTVILLLFAGPYSTVLAQDPERATWTHVTGTAQQVEWIGDAPNDPTHRWYGSVEYIPACSASYTVAWSDPRLPTTMRIQQDVALHHGDMTSYDDWMWLHAFAARLDGHDGYWTGSGHGVIGTAGEQGHLVLTGRGGYAGLSALLDVRWPASDVDNDVLGFDGWIFRSPLPPMPEPLEPPAE